MSYVIETDSIVLKNRLEDFKLSQVEITEPYRVNAFKKEIKYLKSIIPDKLIAGFYETKGLKPKAEKYSGWEDTEIRGHTMGHFLTALSQAYSCTNDPELLNILNYIMEELESSQMENGYLSAFEETLFDKVENKIPAWVPWYTMHKIIAGLIQVYYHTNNNTAYEIVTKLGDWVFERASRWTEEIQKRVLAVEYGGMNDCMYELYNISGNENHLIAAHKFDEISLFKPIAEGRDILNGLHANTTIPKFLGALNRYKVLGDKECFYLIACINFWDLVVKHHSYIIGGNSEGEHFGEPDVLDAERTNCTCETCNTYNMLRLSKELFKITGDKKYADFYENTLTNAILSSQNPETGMTTYFQPMATGYFKVYGTPFDKFWCCTGTGMENFTNLNSSIYFHEKHTIYVNQYVSSVLLFDEVKVKLTQKADIPEGQKVKFTIATEEPAVYLDLRFRCPDWACAPISICVNGSLIESKSQEGYLVAERHWEDGDTVEITLPMTVKASTLQDNSQVAAFRYGPIVLSAALGDEDMTTATTGVMVTIPCKNIPVKDFITINNGEVEDWFAHIEENMTKSGGKLEFRLHNTDEDSTLVFTPHYKQHTQRYGIYWNFVKPDSPELKQLLFETAQKQRLEEAIVDSIPVGNDQYELEHEIKGEKTEVGTYDENRYRYIQQGGWFSYRMKVDPEKENHLLAKYHSKLSGGTVAIYVNDTLLAKETIRPIEPFGIYSRSYSIPSDIISSETVTVKFVSEGEKEFGGLFDILRIARNI